MAPEYSTRTLLGISAGLRPLIAKSSTSFPAGIQFRKVNGSTYGLAECSQATGVPGADRDAGRWAPEAYLTKMSKNGSELTDGSWGRGQTLLKISAIWRNLVRFGAMGQTREDRKRAGHPGVAAYSEMDWR